ncbi:MAG: SDR family NAD(P)-dependent oxidoreductase, partial [Flavobacterium sp.]
MENILIITGGSKGIGKGIVSAYLKKGTRIFSIARSADAELTKHGVTQIELDLTEIDKIEPELLRIFSLMAPDKISKITLINNAGTLGKISTLEKLDASVITKTINLNATVPFLCSAVFVAATKDWKAKKSIINISSGAAL